MVHKMEQLERVCELLFELSSVERLRILEEIRNENLKMSHLSKKLDMTTTETYRHLQRLTDVTLVQKETDGTYSLTRLGNLTLYLLEGLFLVGYDREYFLTHDLSCLPSKLISRIGEISSGTREGDVMSSFQAVGIMIKEAEDHVWIISPQILPSATQILPEPVSKGLEFRVIIPKDVIPPPGVRPVPGTDRRVLDKVPLAMIITEKEAGISLPKSDGSIDYVGYGGTDSRLLEWAHDLFLYFWEKAIPSTKSPVQNE